MNKEEIEQMVVEAMSRRSNGSLLNKAVLWLSLLVSIGTLGALLWRGGAMMAVVERCILDQSALSMRVTTLEMGSTTGAKEFMAADVVRDKITDERLAKLEAAFVSITEIKADIAVIKQQLLERKQ